ncbi:ComF family protein [Devosia rhodophyticola]|uniref:ComF family protein n=1 Tax=Devosia rhodophyticola TaxID=3026423 RepID=A0ABY7YTN6_9HYPH|nr:ComF family protein [Devosia rhodophyticola]WDR04703.1 ComF family protein [Devosia rhodophyticola]
MLYPPVCLVCDEPVVSHDSLCGDCFGHMRAITAPLCPVLGVPFAADIGSDAISAEAIADPPPFARARAAVIYSDHVGRLISRMKYGDRPELARFCARLMVGAGHGLLAGDPILVPVPLHRRRQFRRRYNQSSELARQIGKLTGLRVEPQLAVRVKPTRQQVGLSAKGRARNVVGAFEPHPEALARSGGRRVVLVDDVYTTGATVNAVTRALQRGGIDQIDVLSFARVVSGEELPI